MTSSRKPYTHLDAERSCRLCVPVARGTASDDTMNQALEHQEQIQSEVLRVLNGLAVDGEEGLAHCPLCDRNRSDVCGIVETDTGLPDGASEYGCYYKPNLTFVF